MSRSVVPRRRSPDQWAPPVTSSSHKIQYGAPSAIELHCLMSKTWRRISKERTSAPIRHVLFKMEALQGLELVSVITQVGCVARVAPKPSECDQLRAHFRSEMVIHRCRSASWSREFAYWGDQSSCGTALAPRHAQCASRVPIARCWSERGSP